MVDAVVEGIPKDELTVERVRTEVRALTEKIAAKQVRPKISSEEATAMLLNIEPLMLWARSPCRPLIIV